MTDEKFEYEDASVLPQVKKKEQEVSKLIEKERENSKKIVIDAEKKASLLIEETKKKLPELREKRREESINKAKVDAERIRSEGEQLLKGIKDKANPNIRKVAKIVLTEIIPS
jgi:vacuolar-type H+-ATPase subunit H